jgi:Flp pilus assembly protein TadB
LWSSLGTFYAFSREQQRLHKKRKKFSEASANEAARQQEEADLDDCDDNDVDAEVVRSTCGYVQRRLAENADLVWRVLKCVVLLAVVLLLALVAVVLVVLVVAAVVWWWAVVGPVRWWRCWQCWWC